MINKKEFSNLILWSKENFSYLPWRKNRTLYKTLVSEIMLQQTTVNAVLNRFDDFISKFKNFSEVASASDEELAVAWKGLGYYRRCRNLKKACTFIMEENSGKIPETEKELIKIPGIGVYTANAILSIGRNNPSLAVDANLERVLNRYLGLNISDKPSLKKILYDEFNKQKIIKKDTLINLGPRDFNESIMDLGRTTCKESSADCKSCKLKPSCKTYQVIKQDKIIFKKKSSKKLEKVKIYLVKFIKFKGDKLLMYQKNENEWLSGQWEIPSIVITNKELKNFNQYPQIVDRDFLEIISNSKNKYSTIKSYITKYEFINVLFTDDLKQENKELYQLVESKLKEHLNNRFKFKEVKENSNYTSTSLKILKKVF